MWGGWDVGISKCGEVGMCDMDVWGGAWHVRIWSVGKRLGCGDVGMWGYGDAGSQRERHAERQASPLEECETNRQPGRNKENRQ